MKMNTWFLALAITGSLFASGTAVWASSTSFPQGLAQLAQDKEEEKDDDANLSPELQWLNKFKSSVLPVAHKILMALPKTITVKNVEYTAHFAKREPKQPQKTKAAKNKKVAFGFSLVLQDAKGKKLDKGNCDIILLGDPTKQSTKKVMAKAKASLKDACPS